MLWVDNSFGGQETQLAPGSVFGVRSWSLRVTDGGLRLRGGYGQLWEPGVSKARCLKGWGESHSHMVVPHSACSCGIYAFWGPEAEEVYGLTGVVEGWGRTLLGSLGFRCEFAAVRALCLSPYSPRALLLTHQRLAHQWGVPVFLSRKRMLRAFPLSAAYRTN